ncbi:MAG TPA: hypothetical protein VFZ41_06985 [Solirubrobacterales bacterium]
MGSLTVNARTLLFAVPPVGVKVKRTLMCSFRRCLSDFRAEGFSFSLFTPAVTLWVSRLIPGFRLVPWAATWRWSAAAWRECCLRRRSSL